MRIFISIPAYRDPDLLRTVRDLTAKAARPEALTFAILEQTESPVPVEVWPCWARARIQERIRGRGVLFAARCASSVRPGPG